MHPFPLRHRVNGRRRRQTEYRFSSKLASRIAPQKRRRRDPGRKNGTVFRVIDGDGPQSASELVAGAACTIGVCRLATLRQARQGDAATAKTRILNPMRKKRRLRYAAAEPDSSIHHLRAPRSSCDQPLIQSRNTSREGRSGVYPKKPYERKAGPGANCWPPGPASKVRR